MPSWISPMRDDSDDSAGDIANHDSAEFSFFFWVFFFVLFGLLLVVVVSDYWLSCCCRYVSTCAAAATRQYFFAVSGCVVVGTNSDASPNAGYLGDSVRRRGHVEGRELCQRGKEIYPDQQITGVHVSSSRGVGSRRHIVVLSWNEIFPFWSFFLSLGRAFLSRFPSDLGGGDKKMYLYI